MNFSENPEVLKNFNLLQKIGIINHIDNLNLKIQGQRELLMQAAQNLIAIILTDVLLKKSVTVLQPMETMVLLHTRVTSVAGQHLLAEHLL